MTDPSDALRDLVNALEGDDSAQTPAPPPPKPPAEPASHRPESPIAKHPPPTPPPAPKPPEPGSHRPESPVESVAPELVEPIDEHDESEASASALAELSGAASAVFSDPGHVSHTRRRQRVPKPDVGMMTFRAAAVPVLSTVALLMTVLGIWGIMVKAGNTTLPMADRPNADQYATLALVGLMLGVLLFAGAGFYLYLYLQDRKKLARWEEAQEAERRV